MRQSHSFNAAFSVVFPYGTEESGCFLARFHLRFPPRAVTGIRRVQKRQQGQEGESLLQTTFSSRMRIQAVAMGNCTFSMMVQDIFFP